MYDIHAHVIPNIDDGAKDMATATAMLQAMYQQGIEGVIATPHIRLGKFDNDLASIASAFDALKSHLPEQGVPELRYAAEVHLTVDLMQWVMKDTSPYLARFNDKKHLLLEFPETVLPPGAIKLCQWLLQQGVVPIIAHPERYRFWQSSPRGINRFIEIGCLLQLTAGSVLGQFRAESLELAMQLIKDDKVFCIASDTHNLTHRACRMKDAKEAVEIQFGVEQAEKLFVTNPKAMFTRCNGLG